MPTKDNLNNSLPLPADSMPECWSKDERMNALFAEFRNRSVNSQDWDSKYKFWEKIISDWLSYKQLCTFSVSDLNIAFKRNGRTPLCLTTVVGELLRNGEIITEAEFLKESSGSWTGWAIDTMVKRPVAWSFSKLKNYIVKDVIDIETKYVHLKTVRDLGKLILSTIDEENDNVLIPLSEVTKNCIEKSRNENITEQNVKLALLWLRHSKKAASRGENLHNKSGLLVKISNNGAKEVSEAEEGLFKLMEQEKLITKNIERLEVERNAILAKAKSSLANGLREVAKTCVRKKREVDKSIEKRSNALHNVQTLIARIHDAHSNTEILSAYKTGSEILKNFESTGLTEENVINTMDNMSEAVSEIADLQSFMSTSIGTLDSDVDLEEELQELLDSSPIETSSKDEVPARPKLPDVADLPDLHSELSALNLEDLPLPPKTFLQASSPS